MSGLPLRARRRTSFERHLRLLAGFFRGRGRQTQLLGPDASIQARGAQAAILLGYPDQFPILSAPSAADFPLYIWAQCSRPPDPRAFAQATAVPLTGMSASFLARAGVRRLGPVIPHGVDTRQFRPPGPQERARARRALGVEGRFVAGAVGSNSFRKRYDRILESFALFRRSRPEALLVIHTDRSVSREGRDLRRMAERLGIKEHVLLLTEDRAQERMFDLYAAMDLFLNLSEWEGFGLPVAEAMACALPVVTHRVQGPGELVPYSELMAEDSVPYEEGGSALLTANPQTVARLLERAAADPNLRARLGAQGRAEAERRFDLSRIAGLWEDLINRDTG